MKNGSRPDLGIVTIGPPSVHSLRADQPDAEIFSISAVVEMAGVRGR
jgi:hypothetical protein